MALKHASRTVVRRPEIRRPGGGSRNRKTKEEGESAAQQQQKQAEPALHLHLQSLFLPETERNSGSKY
jgi:hypothetical protein